MLIKITSTLIVNSDAILFIRKANDNSECRIKFRESEGYLTIDIPEEVKQLEEWMAKQ
jgi:hypothetical protein